MSEVTIVPLPGAEDLAESLVPRLHARLGELEVHVFPDGETRLRFVTDPVGAPIALIARLDRPDAKLTSLLFAAFGARELGARDVGLVAPYLPYMRQDQRFRPGEVISSVHLGELLSDRFDWLVTVDPHLHRHHDLAELFTIPATAAHAAPLLAKYIRAHVEAPMLIGPDEESLQWVAAVAAIVGAPYAALRKTRRGDSDVDVSEPPERWRGRTPVLLDDIVSTGCTMTAAIAHLRAQGTPAPVCLAVHGIFAGSAYHELQSSGAASIVTSNTVSHLSNDIDVAPLLAEALRRYVG